MSYVIAIRDLEQTARDQAGGKASSLARLANSGFTVPPAVCITADAYRVYVRETGIRERIGLELNRKPFSDMRWEEMWDAALRIRNMFVTTPLPACLADQIVPRLEEGFADSPVCVRSSSLAEDSCDASFAGLHDSFVNVLGIDSIVDHMRLVWASLWSDAALLYRRELGLSITNSAMPVIVQLLVDGDASGVAFSEHPENRSAAIIEAVHGLNEGLVSGTIDPDRWILDRDSGQILEHAVPSRSQKLDPVAGGVRAVPLSASERETPPLESRRVEQLHTMMMEVEKLFDGPRDIEWTWNSDGLHLLQARPLTTRAPCDEEDEDDLRPWYMSLRVSLEGLLDLRHRIEHEILPEMTRVADACAGLDPSSLSDGELADELEWRIALYDHWRQTYWDELIPFAHGMRLFGEIYNDCVCPDDPYEFMELLNNTPLLSLRRNSILRDIGIRLLELPEDSALPQELTDLIDDFLHQFGGVSEGGMTLALTVDAVRHLAVRLAARPEPPRSDTKQTGLEDRFLAKCTGLHTITPGQLLDLARASYRFRDDDNLYLGRIEAAMLHFSSAAGERLESTQVDIKSIPHRERVKALRGRPFERQAAVVATDSAPTRFIRHSRQLSGQPACGGVVHGSARVVHSHEDLLAFLPGEIMICDAIQPHMTVIAPLAAGIVERRGGMLIHGAIIAREYAIPCVTGVPAVTDLVKTGERLTVDGYLGIVVNHRMGA
jgi:pyruvate,water dikinase